MMIDRGILPENLPPAEDVKKVERRLASEEKKALGNKNNKGKIHIPDYTHPLIRV
jgi:DNA-damage-inducible protein D